MGVLTPVPLTLRAMIFFVKGDVAAAETEAAAGLAASKRAEMPLYDPRSARFWSSAHYGVVT
ncbi:MULTISPECIES: hypothetical protein [unclassified Streptomyces]|nr:MULTISPECIES: hypothetical protein [unclassified Streptomyces]MBD3008990.1 hypothetical protein [Streptomyces sp. 5-10]